MLKIKASLKIYNKNKSILFSSEQDHQIDVENITQQNFGSMKTIIHYINKTVFKEMIDNLKVSLLKGKKAKLYDKISEE
jgi:hypothetical protein